MSVGRPMPVHSTTRSTALSHGVLLRVQISHRSGAAAAVAHLCGLQCGSPQWLHELPYAPHDRQRLQAVLDGYCCFAAQHGAADPKAPTEAVATLHAAGCDVSAVAPPPTLALPPLRICGLGLACKRACVSS